MTRHEKQFQEFVLNNVHIPSWIPKFLRNRYIKSEYDIQLGAVSEEGKLVRHLFRIFKNNKQISSAVIIFDKTEEKGGKLEIDVKDWFNDLY